MASKVIHALYNDDDILMHAVKEVRAKTPSHRRGVHTFSCARA